MSSQNQSNGKQIREYFNFLSSIRVFVRYCLYSYNSITIWRFTVNNQNEKRKREKTCSSFSHTTPQHKATRSREVGGDGRLLQLGIFWRVTHMLLYRDFFWQTWPISDVVCPSYSATFKKGLIASVKLWVTGKKLWITAWLTVNWNILNTKIYVGIGDLWIFFHISFVKKKENTLLWT